MLTTSLLIGVAAALAALAFAAFSLPAAHPKPAKNRPTQDYTPMNRDMWVPGWPHEAPPADFPFTVAQAHQVMRTHRACRRSTCPRKDAAWMTLVDAGHIRPRTEAW